MSILNTSPICASATSQAESSTDRGTGNAHALQLHRRRYAIVDWCPREVAIRDQVAHSILDLGRVHGTARRRGIAEDRLAQRRERRTRTGVEIAVARPGNAAELSHIAGLQRADDRAVRDSHLWRHCRRALVCATKGSATKAAYRSGRLEPTEQHRQTDEV